MKILMNNKFRLALSCLSIFLLIIFSLPITAPIAQAAVILDSTSSANTGFNVASSLTWSHTVSGQDKILIVGVSVNGKGTVSAVTYGVQNLTRIAVANKGSSAAVSLWYLLNPASGSNNVRVATSIAVRFVAGATSYTGVDQTNPIGQPAVNSGVGTSAIVNIGSNTSELVVDVIARRGDLTTNPMIVGSEQIQNWNNKTTVNDNNIGITGGSSSRLGAKIIRMQWNWSSNREWAAAGVSLKLKLYPGDTIPPMRFNGLPYDSIPAGTTQTTLSLMTDENATCRYALDSGVSYAAMVNTFEVTGGIAHSQTIYNLSDGNSYNFYVRCLDGYNNSNSDDYIISFNIETSLVDTSPPTVPTNLSVDLLTSSRVDFSWLPAIDNVEVIGYKIFRDGIQVGSVEDTHYVGVGVIESTTYTYTVSAFDASGNESEQSEPLIITTPSLDNNPPVISQISISEVSTSNVTITWQTDEPATSQVEYGFTTTYGQITAQDLNLITEHSVVIENLSANSSYNYRIISTDANGNGAFSLNNIFITSFGFDATPPATIIDLGISNIGPTSLDLSWTASGDNDNNGVAASYDIRFSTAIITDFNWDNARQLMGLPMPALAGSIENYIVIGLSPNTKYYFAIRVIDASGNISSLSNVVFATTYVFSSSTSGVTNNSGNFMDSIPPSQPENFVAIAANNQVVLRWQNPPEVDFVRVLIIRKDGTEPISRDDGIRIYEGNNERYTDANLENGKIYYYAIYAYDRFLNYSEPLIVGVHPEEGIINIPQISEQPIEYVEESKVSEIEEPAEAKNQSLTFFTKSVYYGLFDIEIGLLQSFLANNASIYPEKLITGYFGDLTRNAVKRFQCKYGIVCSGDENSTGYGRVGIKTLIKLNQIQFGK